jgi:YafQ family addiction module toxin component
MNVTYNLEILPDLQKKLQKLGKKNRNLLINIDKKVQEIRINPYHYKNLNYPLNDLRRVHIDKHFVLVFKINDNSKTVILVDFDHHDKIY